MKKNTDKRIITINIKKVNWEKLQMIKLKGEYRSLDEVIEKLLGER